VVFTLKMEGAAILRNVGILSDHYMMSQPRRPSLEHS